MMILTIVIGIVSVLLALRWLTHKKTDLSHIPGPSTSPWWQIFNPPDATKIHLIFEEMAQKYGPVMKIPQPGTDILVVSDFDSIYKVLVTEGKTFGGRPSLFRVEATLGTTGIANNLSPDKTWKSLRKITQSHIRQFGDGLSRLELIIEDIANDMMEAFETQIGKPHDPYNDVFQTGLNSIAFFIIGKRLEGGDPVLEMMREYTNLFLNVTVFDAPVKYRILDALPWLRHLNWPGWSLIKRMLYLEQNVWKYSSEYAENNPDAESLCKVFKESIAKGNKDIDLTDAVKSTLLLLLAGVATTSNSFYGLINILAHNQDIQEKLWKEQQKIEEETGCEVTLKDRPQMPYTRAVLLELSRYQTVVPLGVPHENSSVAEINGYKVPAGTLILTLLWGLHHDKRFWGDPHVFRPERFLDDRGDLIPADHPNRKHLMPFGAGTRVCLGESLAITRLFLWSISMVRRFVIAPAKGNEKSSVDADRFVFTGNLQSAGYEVTFSKRP